MMSNTSKVECHKCEFSNVVDMSEKQGAYFWTCSNCGAECGMTVSYPMEDFMSPAEREEHERKRDTLCSIQIVYSGIKDVVKFKELRSEFKDLGNSKLIEILKESGGLKIKNISLLKAEREKLLAESLGLTVEINV
jgi:ribosomal protein L37AE/L43A